MRILIQSSVDTIKKYEELRGRVHSTRKQLLSELPVISRKRISKEAKKEESDHVHAWLAKIQELEGSINARLANQYSLLSTRSKSALQGEDSSTKDVVSQV